jgi:hypothetical protein
VVLALLAAHHIFPISRIKVKPVSFSRKIYKSYVATVRGNKEVYVRSIEESYMNFSFQMS